MNNLYWVLKATINEGQLEALQVLTKDLVKLTQAESGALAYEWSISEDQKSLHIYERYIDSEAALAHLANVGEHLPKLMQLIAPTTMECYGPASNQFKQAVAGLPVVYFNIYDSCEK
jgi:quinol monooxygenase YgiN